MAWQSFQIIIDLLHCTEPYDVLQKTVHRGSYTSGHFIWNLWNQPLASFINFRWNRVRFCLSNDCFKWNLIALKVDIIWLENIMLSWLASWHYTPVTKCYVTCGHTIFWDDVSHWITATSYDKCIYLAEHLEMSVDSDICLHNLKTFDRIFWTSVLWAALTATSLINVFLQKLSEICLP